MVIVSSHFFPFGAVSVKFQAFVRINRITMPSYDVSLIHKRANTTMTMEIAVCFNHAPGLVLESQARHKVAKEAQTRGLISRTQLGLERK